MGSIERERVPTQRPIPAREIPLIDRVEEMKLLKEAADRTIQGEGGLVFLYGEAGIGKTRLARELATYAHLRGMQVLYGRCPALFRMDGVPPYVIWKEIIKEYLEISTPEQLYRVIGYYPAEVAKLVPELSQKLRSIPQSFPIGPEQEQNRLFEAVSQFVTNISREAPLLVVLDDLQWTDASSLLLFHYLARGVQKTPLLLLGAYRSTDIDAEHPLSPVLTELNRERLARPVSLKRMSLEDISEMIKQILEQDDVLTEFCKLVYEKTRGNPFFAEEVIKSLKEEEAIYREANKWKIKEVTKIEFPETVKSVIKTRTGRLDDEQRNVLTMASLVGNDFTFEALQGVTGSNEDELRKIVDGLLKTGLLKHRDVRGEDVCSFADVIVRDVVSEEVGTYERKKLHEVVGTALEKVYAAKIDEHLGELALHFLEAGDKDKALGYFLKAGDKATDVYANNEAVSYFQSALKLLESKEGETRERARVLERLGEIKMLIGENDLGVKYLNEALLLWKQLDEKEKVARLHRKMAFILWTEIGDTEQAQENLEKALRILEAGPENVELAALYEAWAFFSVFHPGDITKARSWAEKALELAKKLNASEVAGSAYHDLGIVFGATGEQKQAVECMEKALKIALDNSYVRNAVLAYNNLAAELPAEENERRLDCHEKALELSKKAGMITGISWGQYAMATEYFRMGDIEKALTLAEESDTLSRKIGNLFNMCCSTSFLGLLYHVKGEWNKGEQCLKESLSISQKIKNPQEIAASYWGLGWSYYDMGQYSKAKEFFDALAEVNEKRGKALQVYGYRWLAMNDIELGDIDKAKALLDDIHKFAHEIQDKQLIADEDTRRAMLLRGEKRWDESIELFKRSLQENEALGARRWNAYWFAKLVLYEYSRVYLERNQPGDKEKARDLLNQALQIFQKMEAKKDIEKTMTLLEALNPPSTQTLETKVSPKAHEVIDLQCNMIATPKELKIGESLELEIELSNTRKEGSMLLTKIAEVVPEGFAVAKRPESYRVEGNCLNMKEKQLDPMKKEEVKLVLIPKIQGTFHIKPKITYLDENGKEKTCEPKPVSITVKELGIKGWLKGER